MQRPPKINLIIAWMFVAALYNLFILFSYPYAGVDTNPFNPLHWWYSQWVPLSTGSYVAYVVRITVWVNDIALILGLVGGVGLLRGTRWGRIIGLIHSWIVIFIFPIVGTAIGVLVLLYLYGQNGRSYFQGLAERASETAVSGKPNLLSLVAVWMLYSALAVFAGVLFLLMRDLFPAWYTWEWRMSSPFYKGLMHDIYVYPAFAVYIILALAGGIYLLRGKICGYILGIIHAVLTLAWTPLGTIVGILVLIYMLRPAVRGYYKGVPAP